MEAEGYEAGYYLLCCCLPLAGAMLGVALRARAESRKIYSYPPRAPQIPEDVRQFELTTRRIQAEANAEREIEDAIARSEMANAARKRNTSIIGPHDYMERARGRTARSANPRDYLPER